MKKATENWEIMKKKKVSVFTQIFLNFLDSSIQTHETSFDTYKFTLILAYDEPLQIKNHYFANGHQQNKDKAMSYREISADKQYLKLTKSTNELTRLCSHDHYKEDKKLDPDSRFKILIIGEEYTRNLARILDLVMNTSNKILYEVIQPKCELSSIKDLQVLNYGSNTSVIIMFNAKMLKIIIILV